MSSRDFSVQGKEFKCRKLDVTKQWRIARRLGPIVGDIIKAAVKFKKTGKDIEKNADEAFEMFLPIFNGLSKLSDEDADYVLFGLASAVEMKQPEYGTWANIATESGQLMMQNIELFVLVQCSVRSFMYNMSGFFLGNQQNLSEPDVSPKGK